MPSLNSDEFDTQRREESFDRHALLLHPTVPCLFERISQSHSLRRIEAEKLGDKRCDEARLILVQFDTQVVAQATRNAVELVGDEDISLVAIEQGRDVAFT